MFCDDLSPKGWYVLWEQQEQASCFRADSLINWNIRDKMFQISNSWNTKKRKTVLLCMIIKVITRLRVRSFLKWQTWWSTNIYMVSQILTNVKEITLVTWMLPARTPTDPIFVNATLDLMEMVKAAQVNLISLLQYLEYSRSNLIWSCWGGHCQPHYLFVTCKRYWLCHKCT